MIKNILVYIAIIILAIQKLIAQELVDGEIVSESTFIAEKATNDYVSFYQKRLSAFKNAQCAMYPSCSNYGKAVLEDFNFIQAIPLITDRMIRCSHDIRNYDITYKYGRASLIDCPNEEYKKTLLIKTEPRTSITRFSKDSTINFITTLINNKEYSSALLETRRAEFYKKTEDLVELQKIKLICLRGIGEYEKAIYEYETLTNDCLKNNINIALEASKIYYLIGNYKQCIVTLNQKLLNENHESRHDANIIKAAAHANIGNINETINAIDTAINISDNKYINDYNKSFANEFKNLKFKSPTIAKILSIIPGTGYLYAGHPGSAATAFFINGLLAYATYTSIKSDNYGIAALTGFFSISFYIGNINGAGKSAKRYNESRKNKLIKNFEHMNNIFNQ